MALRKSTKLLPGIFQTKANEKYLNATLDQLISEPNNTQINQFIGRKTGGSFQKNDSYVSESTPQRQNYQLEPAVVYKDSTGNIKDVHTVDDTLNSLRYHNASTVDQSALFSQEYYNYEGFVDMDKLVNYGEYFWLPQGPETVNVGGNILDDKKTFIINRTSIDSLENHYTVDNNTDKNPVIYLARGGEYTFNVDQAGIPFYIQTEIGTSGVSSKQSNVSTREIQGVINNGEDQGSVIFRVPNLSDIDFYQNMPVVQNVSFATDLVYTQIHNQLRSRIDSLYGGIDGTLNYVGKTLVFANNSADERDWEAGGIFDGAVGFDSEPFDPTTALTFAERYSIFRIDTVSTGDDELIQLTKIADIPELNRVSVQEGVTYARRQLYKNSEQYLEIVPVLTSTLDTLYYQDSVNANMFGRIVLVDQGSQNIINVDSDIVGQQDYTSPNNVVLENGLKIEFDGSVLPESYQNTIFYVEGVGKPGGICLVPESKLITPESYTNDLSQPFDSLGFDSGNFDGTDNSPIDPDYILINRASRDNNGWSRYNRWFHKRVIENSAAYNNFTLDIDQNSRAKRPIIEFMGNIQLFNSGTNSREPVSLFDTTQTDALSNVASSTGYFTDNIQLASQMRIVFSADMDPDIRRTVYRVDFIDQDSDEGTAKIIDLVPVETLEDQDNITVNFGFVNQGKTFTYNNTSWTESQAKTSLMQEPLFDVFDSNHKSLSDTTVYPGNNFAGTKLFSYKRNTVGAQDSVLGFGLSYRNFNNIGDILFDNNFASDTFQYTKTGETDPVQVIIKSGHIHKHDYNTGTRSINNGWRRVANNSQQFQIVTHVANAELYSFEIGVAPSLSVFANIKVYVNNKFIPSNLYTTPLINNKNYIVFDNPVNQDDNIVIKIYSAGQTNLGYYEVPVNLENNANNEDFDNVTLGQIRNHFVESVENVPDWTGNVLGSNTVKDIDIAAYPGKILQHSAGHILSSYLLNNKHTNFFDSLQYSSNEYTRFKNRFLDNIDKLDIDLLQPDQCVDKIIEFMNGSKTNAFPFYYSDMLPWGDQKTIYNYVVDNPSETSYEFGTQFDLNSVSQRSVLVYLTQDTNKRQLLHGEDYTLDSQVAAINLSVNLAIKISDIITIVEYSDTDGSFVPPTPSKLGLWHKYKPTIYLEEVAGYVDANTGPYKLYGTLDPDYEQRGKGTVGFVYPLYTDYQDAAARDTQLGGTGGVHLHKFVGSSRLFYMPNSTAFHGATDNPAINIYPGLRSVIRGHDGSKFVGFGDIRDNVLLELESRIYNNIKTQYNKNLLNWDTVLTGFFRNTPTERAVELDILRSSWGSWAEKNRVDQTSNTTFSTENRFTWNYSQAADKIEREILPGGYRAIYNWLYDTDTPHITPWEMLGLSEKPSWWDTRYGKAPYTSGNTVLWEDLRDGKLYQDALGNDYTIIDTSIRADLMELIPVDAQGNLLPPSDFVGHDIFVSNANLDWKFGDWSPQETAWRHSSEYPFAIQLLGMLKAPAKYATLLWDANLYEYNADLEQIVQNKRTYRPSLDAYKLHTVQDATGGVNRTEGYNQFIANYLIYSNHSTDDIQVRVQNLELNLAYKVAGFTDKKFLKVAASNATPNSSNNNIFVPDEDVNIVITDGTPVAKVFYSAVKITRTENGYRINGYDSQNPFFKIVPSVKNENATRFSITNDNVFTLYNDYDRQIVTIPYGLTLTTQQQVVDFLNALQRYYNSQGIVFDTQEDGVPVDFKSGAKEFVFWAAQGWVAGTVFSISPAYNILQVSRNQTTIADLSNGINLRDYNGKPIRNEDYKVSRIDNTTTITVNTENTQLASASIDPIQYEHVLVFNNTTIFNDLIYNPALGNRQERLKVIGQKTGDWNGTLHAPGFIISNDIFDIWQSNQRYRRGDYVSFRNDLFVAKQDHNGVEIFNYEFWDRLPNYKSGLLKNTAHRSSDFENYFDIDKINLESNVDAAGKGIIGFRKREWLENLGLDDVSQVKFYQGMIKQKGTSQVINKLINADLTNLDQDINFYEEWGFRVGEYGSTDSNQVVEVVVDESNSVNNPITLEFLDTNDAPQNPNNIKVTSSDLYRTPRGYTNNIWKTRTSTTPVTDLNTVGYPRIDDVDHTILDIDENLVEFGTDLSNIGRGDKVWVAHNRGDWDVFRIDETLVNIVGADNLGTEQTVFTFDTSHGLVKDDIIVVKTNDPIAGAYRVQDIPANNTVVVNTQIPVLDSVLVEPAPVYKFFSVRFNYLKDLSGYSPAFGFQINETVWVDNDTTGKWAAYRKNHVWDSTDVKTSTATDADSQLGNSVAINSTGGIALSGAPLKDTGIVVNYKLQDNVLDPAGNISITNSALSKFGWQVACANTIHAISAPGTNSNSGSVFVYTSDSNNDLTLSQVLCPSASANREFGYSVAVSSDQEYITVGAPGANIAHVYKYKTSSGQTKQITGNGNTTYALGFTPNNAESVLVQTSSQVYIPFVDYTVSGSNIVFSNPVLTGTDPSVTETNHYTQVATLVGSGTVSGDRFGHSIDIDRSGRTIVVGSPNADVVDSSSTLIANAGEVYVFNNTVEAFVANGTQTDFVITNNINTDPVVKVDVTSTTAFEVSGQTIEFENAPAQGSIVSVVTGTFQETQKLDQNITGENPTAGEQYGSAVGTDVNGVLVAVGSPGEDETRPNTGSVFVYADSGLRLNIVQTDGNANSYTSGDTFFVNDREITASSSDTTLATFVADVNLAKIAGVSAQLDPNNSNRAQILGNNVRVRPGTGNTFRTGIGVQPFVLLQKINHPAGLENENFGQSLAFNKYISSDGTVSSDLVISSSKNSTLIGVGFDAVTDSTDPLYRTYQTTFDTDGTLFTDRITQSGAAYTYQFAGSANESLTNLPQFIFEQKLTNSSINTLDEFGSSVAYMNKTVLVGSRKDDEYKTNAGSVYEFHSSGVPGWSKNRTETAKVDINLFNNTMLYSKQENEVLEFLDYIDPYKLKIAGGAQQEIDYLTDYDPATYSTGNEQTRVNVNNPWNDEYVGRVWWDLSTALFLEYEQGELDYRTQNWGKMFPGATIDVYEWTESTVPPAQYTDTGGEGTPKSLDDFAVQTQYDSVNNSTITKYYYWVQNKETVPAVDFRRTSISTVARLIQDPVANGVKHLQFIDTNAVNMVNISKNLDADNTVLSINYDRIKNEGVLHSQFELVSEGDPDQILPDRIYNKIVDSISGQDSQGNTVPSANLSPANRYGIEIRPRQTVYRNRFKALQVFVDYCNKIFLTFPVARQANLANYLTTSEAVPTSSSGDWDKKVSDNQELEYLNTLILNTGYRVLVETDAENNNRWSIYTLQSDNTWLKTAGQSYNTSESWNYTTWYSPGFNQFTIPLYQVATESDLLTLTTASSGEIAKVLSNDDGNISFYEYQVDRTWKEVIIERGTIQFKTSLYLDYNSESESFPHFEVRNLFAGIKNDVFINQNRLYMNQLFFRLTEYALDEYGNAHPDWLFKSSFIRVTHKLRDLSQYPTFRNDNSEFVENFINEVKPYKTKIRDYTTRYEGKEDFQGDVTDFDIHSFYDTNKGYFRKPSGDFAEDQELRSQGLNVPWNTNYTYRVESVEIYNAGTGYLTDPKITLSAPDLSTGVQATATATTNGNNIVFVTMTNKGSGYTQTPTLTIENESGSGLKLVPRLENNTTRSFDVTLKFDRFTYSTSVKDWTANTSYNYQDLVAYKNPETLEQELYQVIVSGGFTSGSSFSAETENGTVALTVYDDALVENNLDRIAGYYSPTSGMLGDDLNLLQSGLQYGSNQVSGPGFNNAPGFDSSGFDSTGFDAFEIDTDGIEVLSGNLLDTIIKSEFNDSALGTRPEDINVDGGKFVDVYNSHAPEEFVPGMVYDTLDMEVYTDPSDDFERDGNSFRVVHRAYFGNGIKKVFPFRSASRMDDVDIVFAWVNQTRRHDFTVDYDAGTITFVTAPAVAQSVYIYGYGITGEKLTHEQTFTGDGVTNYIVLGVNAPQVQQILVLQNGQKLVKDTDYITSTSDGKTIVTLTGIPAVGDHLHVFTSSQNIARNAFTLPHVQEIALTSGTTTYSLDKTVEYLQPLEGAVVAELGSHRLRPSNSQIYTADGSTLTYSIPTTAGEGAVADGDIRVSVVSRADLSTLSPGANKIVNIDYTIGANDGSSARTITFFDPPTENDTIIISVRTGAEYLVDGNTVTLTSEVSFNTGDVLYITSFSNHDPLIPQSKVFIGLGNQITTTQEGFDSVGFDSSSFDTTTVTGVAVAKYQLDRSTSKADYLWVTLDGARLHPGQYSIDSSNRLDLSGLSVDETSEVIVTSFSENVIQPTVGFRIFKDMLGQYNYFRICDDNATVLAKDLKPADTKIYVADVSKLANITPSSRNPGVIFVGNERITYWEVDTHDNYVTNIRRSTRGTRYSSIHRAGVNVIDASEDNRMPANDTHTQVWYNSGTNTAANGLGIQAATTINANFLKACTAVVQNYTKELDSPIYVTEGYVVDGYVEVRDV